MPARTLKLHRPCGAPNAYNPTLALWGALCSYPTSSNDRSRSATNSFCSASSAHQHLLVRRGHVRSVSTTARTPPDPTKAPAHNGGGEKLGSGGTFGNYEALMASLGSSRSKHIQTKRGVETPQQKATTTQNTAPPAAVVHNGRRQTVHQQSQREEQVVIRRIESAGSREAGEGASLSRMSSASIKQVNRSALLAQSPAFRRDYSWQKHMQLIANRANELAAKPVDKEDTALIEEHRKQLSYVPWAVPPQTSSDASLPIPWRLQPSDARTTDPEALLESEIQRFVAYAEPTPAETFAREAVIREVRAFIKDVLGSRAKSAVFGSQTTGLALSTSDIDIRLVHDNHTVRHKMHKLAARLSASPDYILVVVRYTKYPIISLQHKKTGIDVQIVAAPDSSVQQAVTLQYMAELPHLRSLYFLLRSTLGIRGLHDVFNGGTGSYGLFMMIAASLKRRRSNPPTALSHQLLCFLDFWSQFDTTARGLSISPPRPFKKHDSGATTPTRSFAAAARRRGDRVRAGQWAIGQTRPYQPYLLCLQDPANPVNDLGRKGNAILLVTKTFEHLRAQLAKSMAYATTELQRQRSGSGVSILLPLVGRCHEVYAERRKRVENYGMELIAARETSARAETAAA